MVLAGVKARPRGPGLVRIGRRGFEQQLGTLCYVLLCSYHASLHPGTWLSIGKFNAGGNPEMDWHLIQRVVEILLVASCHGNWNKLWHYGLLPPRNVFFYQCYYNTLLESLITTKS